MRHVGEEARLGSAHRFGLIARGGERFLVVFAFGDVRVDDDDSSFRHRTMPNFKHRPVRTGSFERATLPIVGRKSLHFRFGIDGAVLAPFGEEANEIRIIRPIGKERLG